ncbi:MAG: hypothetical protein DI533_17815 [Cereibacter sphaeroides]|uniref:Uncharacterized protein n=1 Tax=Cereibacter sphaeroides TaxID=1063 RepID=A0A2W5TYN7_CERSP|nr:MAG: hypothetical protein DI533_17815 [Cereibacter sphaeroides]
MIQGAKFLMTGDLETVVARVGGLPDAPLVMPKQQLEAPSAGLSGVFGRLLGRTSVAGTDAQGSGR